MRSRRCGCRSNPSRCWRPIERSGAALVNIACTGAEPPPGCRNRRAFFHRLSGGQQPRQPILDGTFSTKSLFRGMLANRRRSTLLRLMDMPPVSALLKKITRSTPGMRTMPFFRHISLCLFGALACLAPLAFAEAVSPQEQVQVQASRATSSLMLLRGEGFQKKHQDTLDTDLQALASAVQSLPQGSDALRSAHQQLVMQVRRGVTFGPNEADMPWRYPEELSKALLSVLHEARQLAPEGDSELAAKLEYLCVQYLSRAYLGNFEMATLAASDLSKLKVRWDYLKAALNDLNSQSSALQSVSGRAFAPMTVYRHTRSLTQQWMAMQ